MDHSYLAVGTILKERYEILREIGRGGYSIVYAARDHSLDTEVAIKLLVPPPAVAQTARERMRREVQAVRGLVHSNIVGVFDYLEADSHSFIVMEYVPGPDLQERLHRQGPLSIDEAIQLGKDIGSALAAAHRRGILHRDVKPQNILISPDGRSRLTDFGSAKIDTQATVTQTGGLVGTLTYTAPEVIAGQRGDARSDIYALGMSMYYALVGRLPERPSPHLPPPPAPSGFHARTARPDVPHWLDGVVARATVARPGDRYPSASSLADALAAKESATIAPPAAPASHLDFCLLCGAPDPIGLSVCARCGGFSSEAADMLIVVKQPGNASERHSLARSLEQLCAVAEEDSALRAAARGSKALALVPTSGAARVVHQLSLRDVPARALPTGSAWTMIPLPFYGVLALTVGVGGLAGTVVPALLWISPIVTLLLFKLALQSVRTPLLAPTGRAVPLSTSVQKDVIDAMDRIPSGTARGLLADLIRMAQPLLAPRAGSSESSEVSSQLSRLLRASCSAAIDLASLEENLARLDSQRDRLRKLSGQWHDGLARCEQTRDRLVQRLLDAVTVVGQLQSEAAGGPAGAGSRLGELTQEIETQLAATREVEELLRAV